MAGVRAGTVTSMVGWLLFIFIRANTIDVSAPVMVGIRVTRLSVTEIIAETAVVIGSEFIVKGEYTAELLGRE